MKLTMKLILCNCMLLMASCVDYSSQDLKFNDTSHDSLIDEASSDYQGTYILEEKDSTYYGRVIVTTYGKEGKLFLSLCFIDVEDTAVEPKYKIVKGAHTDLRGHVRVGKTIIGSFKKAFYQGREQKIFEVGNQTYVIAE